MAFWAPSENPLALSLTPEHSYSSHVLQGENYEHILHCSSAILVAESLKTVEITSLTKYFP